MLLEAGTPPFGMFRNLKEVFYMYIFVFVFLLFKGTVPLRYNGQVVSLYNDDRHLVGHSVLGSSTSYMLK
jgi:hypothetical protein